MTVPRHFVHCATCGGEMPEEYFPNHDIYHKKHGDFAVQADAIWFAAPREWAAPRSTEEAGELGLTEYQWALLQVQRELVKVLRGEP